MKRSTAKRIVIVGGGSGGLKLATRLGRRYRRDESVQVTLVDGTLTHVWKPLLHEIAAGTLDIHDDECNYLAHARRHHFRFVWGRMQGLDKERRRIELEPLDGNGDGKTVPKRELAFRRVGARCRRDQRRFRNCWRGRALLPARFRGRGRAVSAESA